MYKLKSKLVDPVLLRYAKIHLLKQPRQGKIEFLLAYILSSLENRNSRAAAEGLRALASLMPELKRGWDAAIRSYDGKDDGEWLDTVFREVFGGRGKPRFPTTHQCSNPFRRRNKLFS